ncbi:hypothetical protein MtrunA17_Chr8g0367781 [Medicago truncatula]|uniref:Uncharacterized protein n=1 Tax=Medicago truncatula TaxID=3880 RepID=A0A396GN20_MEDTR|nr:hypothetical protein MtrunA17_Chr8g0367781 [Medicago truncatula]
MNHIAIRMCSMNMTKLMRIDLSLRSYLGNRNNMLEKNLQIGKPPPYKTHSQGGSTSDDQ